jgi:hypothetical protein
MGLMAGKQRALNIHAEKVVFTSNLKRCMVYVGPHTKAQAKKVSMQNNPLHT